MLSKVGINIVLHQWVSTAVLILSLGVSTTILSSNFFCKKPEVLQLILVNLAFNIPVISVFFTEWFMFPESSYRIGLGLFFCVIAINEVQSFKPLKLIISLIFLFLSIGIYQVFVEIFVIFAFCFICRELDVAKVKITLSRIAYVLSIALGASLLNIGMSKIVGRVFGVTMSERSAVFTLKVIKGNIIKLWGIQPRLWNSGLGLLPKYTLLVFFLLLVAFVLYTFFATDSLKNPHKIIFLCMLAISLIITFAPHFISPSFWPAPRTLIALFACFTLTIIFISLNNKNQIVLHYLLIICILFISINYVKIQKMGEDQFITNALDKNFSLTIDKAISDYEAASNVKVSKIAIRNDVSPLYGYYQYVENITYDINRSSRWISWATVPMINFYSGRDLTQITGDQAIFEEILTLENMDMLDLDKHVYFDGDILYLVIY